LTEYVIEIRVTPRPGLLDPEGNAIQHALESLGYSGVTDVRMGKAITVTLGSESEAEAVALAEAMARKLLANPVTEDFQVQVLDGAGAS